MSRKPFFSVGIPAFKASYLKECIQSILDQSFNDFELIIVNDASPENIYDIVHLFNDPRISYYENDKNIGAEHVVDNWNKVLSQAVGDYFILMGDDDTMELNYLEEFANLITKFPTLNVYHCRTNIINENSEKRLITQSWPETESVYENIWSRINFYRNQYISDFVYNRVFLTSVGGFYKLPLAWSSDDISSYIAMNDGGVAHTNKAIFNYRKSEITISSSGNPILKMEAILKEKEWFDCFLTHIPISDNDKIFHRAIIKRVPKYILRKKLHTIVASFRSNGLKAIFFWLRKGGVYNISKGLLLYSMIEWIRTKK